MKILHVCNHFHPCTGGIEKYVYDLCKNLQSLGHQSDVCCLETCAYSKKKLKQFEVYDGIRIYRLPYFSIKFYIISPSVLNFVKDYDIIHIHSMGFFSDWLVLTKLLHGKKIVLNTHGGIFHTKSLETIKRIYFSLWCRLVFKGIDVVIADGEGDKKLFLKVTKNIKTIPNTIETEVFSRIKRRPEKNILLYLGRISKNKRVDNLIKILPFLEKRVPKIKLYVAGKDWEGLVDGLKRLAKDLGVDNNVVFTGEVSEREKMEYLSRCQIFLSASMYEGGLGISVLEAMAVGCPVVVQDNAPARSLVIDRNSGFLTDFEDHEKSANLVLELLNNNLEEVSKNAKTRSKRFDWNNEIKHIENIYKDVLEGK